MQNWDRDEYAHIPSPVNVTERAVRRVLFEWVDQGQLTCCPCKVCMVNVQAIALNDLRSWHIRGWLLLQEDEWPTLMHAAFPNRTEVERAVRQAMERVAQFPKKVAHGERLVIPW